MQPPPCARTAGQPRRVVAVIVSTQWLCYKTRTAVLAWWLAHPHQKIATAGTGTIRVIRSDCRPCLPIPAPRQAAKNVTSFLILLTTAMYECNMARWLRHCIALTLALWVSAESSGHPLTLPRRFPYNPATIRLPPQR